MPSRRKGHLRPVNSDGRPNSVEKLAFKYTEMCRVASSTDESDVSPRSSDTSTMALVTRRPERRPLQKTLSSLSHKAGGRLPCYCRNLDPYDGSSEDSDESHHPSGVLSRRPRQHGGVCSHYLCRSRRLVTLQPLAVAPMEVTKHEPRAPPSTSSTPGPAPLQHPEDILMDSDGSAAELWACGLDAPWSSAGERGGCRGPAGETGSGYSRPEREDDGFEDSGLHSNPRSRTPPASASARSTPRTAAVGSSFLTPSGSSEGSPGPNSYGCCLYKRKMMGPPGPEAVELGQRKKQCVVTVKEEPGQGNGPAEMF